MSAFAAQCQLCKHADRNGNLVVGCCRFDESRGLDADEGAVLSAMLYGMAGKQRCPGRVALVYGPDAYMAEDLPTRAPGQRCCSECPTPSKCTAMQSCLGELRGAGAWPGEVQRQMAKGSA